VECSSSKDLKNTVDEHVPKVLNEKLGYTQSHTIEDVRLALGYGSVIVAGITAYLDYYIGFVEMKSFITVGVVVYFILTALYNGCLYLYERGLIYSGTIGSDTVLIRSITKKSSPEYKLTVVKTDRLTGKSTTDKTLSTQFTELFDYRGFLIYSKLVSWLETELSVSDSKKSK
jgi:hypothetical protein